MIKLCIDKMICLCSVSLDFFLTYFLCSLVKIRTNSVGLKPANINWSSLVDFWVLHQAIMNSQLQGADKCSCTVSQIHL